MIFCYTSLSHQNPLNQPQNVLDSWFRLSKRHLSSLFPRTEILCGCHMKSLCDSEGSCAASLYRSLAHSQCSLLASSCSYYRVYRSAISPRPLCLLCISAWQPQNRRKTCSSTVSLVCYDYGLRVLSFSEIDLNTAQRTAYTTTAPNTAVATFLPSGGSSVLPIMLWWFVANMPPIVLKMMMPKMEMTMLCTV